LLQGRLHGTNPFLSRSPQPQDESRVEPNRKSLDYKVLR
jgi:hypothetical protein